MEESDCAELGACVGRHIPADHPEPLTSTATPADKEHFRSMCIYQYECSEDIAVLGGTCQVLLKPGERLIFLVPALGNIAPWFASLNVKRGRATEAADRR